VLIGGSQTAGDFKMSDNDECRLDLATEVLFAVFNRAWPSMVGDLETPRDLIVNHRRIVDGALRILIWLGLVEAADELEFGYQPTSRLIQILVGRGAGPRRRSKKKEASAIDADTVFSILEAARIEVSDAELRVSACLLLRAIGLTSVTRSSDDIPTQQLHELVAEQRDHERSQRLLLSWRLEKGSGTGNVVRLPV
jgi:hypothetical protein